MSVSTSPLSIRKRSSSIGSASLTAPAVPERLGLLDEAQPQPEVGAVAEHLAHAVGEEAAGHDHVLDAVPAQPLEHEGDERPVDELDDRLGDVRGQRAQARAFAADEDHRLRYASPLIPPIPS